MNSHHMLTQKYYSAPKLSPSRRTRTRAASDGKQMSEEEIGNLASDDAEAFLYESGKGGRKIDEELSDQEKKKLEKEQKRLDKEAKAKKEAEEKGWDQTKDGWKYAKSRGFLRDLWDIVDGQFNGKVGS
eukprot:CAMPEP_0197860112 /NCGR_PEP_ID=MMETSP1438-20131217/35264_1 /TAXON_ID=1461541 /ORGANISM="Pterosperma sp., Strain CCMP1384" /LENGTH=128 /DNA_ID=CAMNT_0043476869 /DNA_START=234 /DNA_END=620 /DNA_ORIENTATION=+